jgi:hypothetical protein
MRISLPLAALVVLLSAAAAAAAPCGPGRHRHCRPASAPVKSVDLTTLPDIGKQIVAGEPAPTAPKKAFDPTQAAPYSGPTIGAAPLPRAPTIGYKWSLE